MHTVHFPSSPEQGIIAAAVGIIFDTYNYDASVTDAQRQTIDKFFDSLMMYENDPEPREIAYGELLDTLDTGNRWVYKGSVTTPPCAKLVYWNVLNKVYPISERHLFLYKQHLVNRPTKKNNYVDYTGNYREIQAYDEHDLQMIVTPSVAEAAAPSTGSTLNVILVCVLFFLSVVVGALRIIINQKQERIDQIK